MINKFIILFSLLLSFSLFANDFVSTKSNKINMRTGPGFHYPVKWIYTCKNLPLKVMEEFEDWKKVCDINEDCGWIKSSLLSGKHYAIIKEDTCGYQKQSIDSKVTMEIDKFVVMKIEKCSEEWCFLSAPKRKAWVQKKYVYGID
ncbi:SH3 domain-containing protein [Wolbachia endosymbiont of Ctenocephalides felis wCfeT]|uniref:SH3 domain-containing protein n=1 Tax=Wolbachia endosymbiont of Ctenocephalides felis wCfeT TaxID=2732593 RepID=UPI0014454849|nr:SH3 domain-containing protein [Wolbachia endosymbiont of Ctenocephalides felis wCfeT]